MQALREKDILILHYLDNNEPQGASLKDISSHSNISQQNAYRYLIKLIVKELVRKDTIGTYHITSSASQNLKLFYVHDTNKSKKYKKQFKPPTMDEIAQATNLHAFEVHYPMYTTEYSRLEAKLATAGIAFKPSGNRKHPSYLILYKGLKIRLGSRQLIAWGPELTEPITVKHEEIEGKALKLNISTVESLLKETGIRTQETINHQLKAHLYYKELAIINNAAVEKLQKGKGYIPIAYDRVSGRASIWLDPTPSPAAETNKGSNHEVLRKWGQGIEDGEIKPYEDEMNTRKDLNGLTSFANKQLELNQSLIESNRDAHKLVLEIKEELKVHRSAYKALERVALKIEDVLKQRRL